MNNLHGFKIQAKREELLEKLRANRARHEQIYLEAAREFQRVAIADLRARVAFLDKELDTPGQDPRMLPDRFLVFKTAAPVSYLEVYNQVIGMLELCYTSSVEITSEQYRNWVEDKWEWTEHFRATNMPYSSKG